MGIQLVFFCQSQETSIINRCWENDIRNKGFRDNIEKSLKVRENRVCDSIRIDFCREITLDA